MFTRMFVIGLIVVGVAAQTVQAGIMYFNRTGQPIEIGLITTFGGEHLYEDCWKKIEPNDSLTIGSGAFRDRVYWVVVKKAGTAIGSWNKLASDDFPCEQARVFIRDSDNRGEILKDESKKTRGALCKDLLDGQWDAFRRHYPSGKEYQALRIRALRGERATLTFTSTGYQIETKN